MPKCSLDSAYKCFVIQMQVSFILVAARILVCFFRNVCLIWSCVYTWAHSFTYFCDYKLSRKVVQNVHLSGGSLLGVSRGAPTVSEIVDNMEVLNLTCKYNRDKGVRKSCFANTSSNFCCNTGKRHQHAVCAWWKWHPRWC